MRINVRDSQTRQYSLELFSFANSIVLKEGDQDSATSSFSLEKPANSLIKKKEPGTVRNKKKSI